LFEVFVLPSTAEACPIVVLEAMAAECPVVATRVGGVLEELPGPEYGWVVPPKNPTALADAIREALVVSRLRTFSSACCDDRLRSYADDILQQVDEVIHLTNDPSAALLGIVHPVVGLDRASVHALLCDDRRGEVLETCVYLNGHAGRSVGYTRP
jgi:hypothetical protein